MIKNLISSIPTPVILQSAKPKEIALITTLPEIFNILTGGLDAYAASRVATTSFSIHEFLDSNEIEGIKATLIFAPSLPGDWYEGDLGNLSQLESALVSQPFNHVINICHVTPFGQSSYFERQGSLLEPRQMDAMNYSFRTSSSGLIVFKVTDHTKNWITAKDKIWASPLSKKNNAQSDRFIYRNLSYDMNRESQQLWDLKSEFSKVVNDDGTIKEIDISSLLGLRNGSMPAFDDVSEEGMNLIKNHPIAVGLQQEWGRHAPMDGWHLSNGLLNAKRTLGDKMPKMSLWALPTLPMYPTQFVMKPELQKQKITHALVDGLSQISQKNRHHSRAPQ